MTISYPRDWPGAIRLKTSRFGLSVNQSVFESALSRGAVVQSHAAGNTDRWQGLFTTAPLREATLGELRALITSLRGGEKTLRLGDPDRVFQRSGVLDSGRFTNWLKDGNRFNLNAWSKLNVTVTADADGTADALQDTSVVSIGNVSQATAVPDDGASYTFSIRVKKTATHIPRFDLILSGGIQVAASTRVDTQDGQYVVSGIGSVSVTDETTYWRVAITVANNESGNRLLTVYIHPSMRPVLASADDAGLTGTVTVKEAQVERAVTASNYEDTTSGPKVNGASQSGRSLNTDAWEVSSVIFEPGDYFEVNGELKLVTERITSTSGGAATLVFEPALRVSPPDNTPIICVCPRATVRLVESEQFWDVDEMGLGQFSFAFEEVI